MNRRKVVLTFFYDSMQMKKRTRRGIPCDLTKRENPESACFLFSSFSIATHRFLAGDSPCISESLWIFMMVIIWEIPFP